MVEQRLAPTGDSALPQLGHVSYRAKTSPPRKHHDRLGERQTVSDKGDRNDKTDKNEKKNVSHVPCKFFRQSICQAGDKCPFSHELDSQTQAVCKYYQKGNCKFGAKCALAHITADGRQVNKRPLKESKDTASRRRERARDDPVLPGDLAQLSPQTSRTKTGSSSSQTSDSTLVDSSVQAASRILSKYSAAAQPQPQSGASIPPQGSSAQPVVQNLPSLPTAQGSSNPPPAYPGSPRINFNVKPFASRSLSSSLPQTAAAQRPIGQLGLLSLGGSPGFAAAPIGTGPAGTASSGSAGGSGAGGTGGPIGAALSPPLNDASLQSSSWTSYRSLFEGSAITDDDDDTVEENDSLEEEEGFREQLVPSTLTDLLTPLERERRNSRTSVQKPGCVFSSPSSGSAPFGFSTRRLSGGSNGGYDVLSTSAPLQDLWSPRPRNQVFPLQRPFEQSETYDPASELSSASIGTKYGHEPPIDLDGAYQPFQRFNRPIAP